MIKHPKVFIISLIALACVILTFTISWYFMLPAAILSAYGWKILKND